MIAPGTRGCNIAAHTNLGVHIEVVAREWNEMQSPRQAFHLTRSAVSQQTAALARSVRNDGLDLALTYDYNLASAFPGAILESVAL